LVFNHSSEYLVEYRFVSRLQKDYNNEQERLS
jgi:hypothetical protein